MTLPQPIDAVIPWVDGDDPAHRGKLNDYLQSVGQRPKSANATRFRETGEFEYCIASLIRFAPWLRTIHIVTDNQSPAFMEQIERSDWRDRVKVVDHRTLFQGFEDYLPTFNSRSIGSVLWRTPGLAERYLFLNDDFVLLRPVRPDDFFVDDQLVLRGKWERQPHSHPLKRLVPLLKRTSTHAEMLSRPGTRDAFARAARVAGFDTHYQRAPHNPHPQLRSILADYFDAHPDALHDNVKYRLRSGNQFLTDALCSHLALGQSKAIRCNRLKTVRLKPDQYSGPGLYARLALANRSRVTAFGCIQSLDRAGKHSRQQVFDWLDRRIGRLARVMSNDSSKI